MEGYKVPRVIQNLPFYVNCTLVHIGHNEKMDSLVTIGSAHKSAFMRCFQFTNMELLLNCWIGYSLGGQMFLRNNVHSYYVIAFQYFVKLVVGSNLLLE